MVSQRPAMRPGPSCAVDWEEQEADREGNGVPLSGSTATVVGQRAKREPPRLVLLAPSFSVDLGRCLARLPTEALRQERQPLYAPSDHPGRH